MLSKINNVLLLIVLVGVIAVGGWRLVEDGLWLIENYFDTVENRKAAKARALKSENAADAQGRRLRTQSVSYERRIEFGEDSPWTVIPIQQTALKFAELLADDEIIVTGSRRRGAMLDYAPAESVRPVRLPFANNLVVLNRNTGETRIVFTGRTAIFEILPLKHDLFPGLIAETAAADTNGDGVITGEDETGLTYVGLADGVLQALSFEGRFLDFSSYRENSPYAHFTVGLDLDASGVIERNYEPKRLYEFAVENAQSRPAVPAETMEALQSILDAEQL